MAVLRWGEVPAVAPESGKGGGFLQLQSALTLSALL